MIWLICPKTNVKFGREGDIERFVIILQMHLDGCIVHWRIPLICQVFSAGCLISRITEQIMGRKLPAST